MNICHCKAPLRDTSSPTRRMWCSRCKGATASGHRPTVDETRRLVDQARSLLEKILKDVVLGTEAVYGIQAPADTNGAGCRPKGSHSTPTERIGRGDPTNDEQPDRWADSATCLALSGQWVKTAVSMLVNADEAAGLALYLTDPHRGPADHVKAPFHDSIPANRPDLLRAHDARERRQGRGEL